MYPILSNREMLLNLMFVLHITCVLSLAPHAPGTIASHQVELDVNKTVMPCQHFWRSTGFCPPLPHEEDRNWFLSEDMNQNLIYIGAVPHRGIENVRIHWLYDAVYVTGLKDGIPVYNFTDLDKFISTLHENQLKVGFELMGNPSNLYTDFDNKTQVMWWAELVRLTAVRYIDKYGMDYVKSWNFETWNEPRATHFDKINMTLQGFLNYFDASVHGLQQADPGLRLGTPGGACKEYDLDKYCWRVLDHVANGINHITGKRNDIAFISIHKKGDEPNNTAVLFEKEDQFLSDLQEHLPSLTHINLYNDEADPLVGWNKAKWWRADATYAATAVNIIVNHQHQTLTRKGNPYTLLSNDNGFLSYNPNFFTQRTLLARFQMNNTKPQHIQFIQKPIYSAMGLLSMLGEQQITATDNGEDVTRLTRLSGFNTLATVHQPDPGNTHDSYQVSAILYNSDDTYKLPCCDARVTAYIKGLNSNDLMYVIYILDNYHGNPYRTWLARGSPKTPTSHDFIEMRKTQDPVRLEGPSRWDPSLPLNFTLPTPGVALIHMCAKADKSPGQVTGLRLHHITTGQLLIRWNDQYVYTKCIKTYEVEFSLLGGSYSRINKDDTIFNSFVFSPGTEGRLIGDYRVRAVDYWDRGGPYSETVPFFTERKRAGQN